MKESPIFSGKATQGLPRPIHAASLAVAALFALFASAGCEETESTGAAAGADQNVACHGSLSNYEFITRIEPPQDPVKAQCLPLDMYWDMKFQVPCMVIEGRHAGADAGVCNACTGKGRSPVSTYSQSLVETMKAENAADDLDCFCAVDQINGSQANSLSDVTCAMDPSDSPVDTNGKPLNGFCYVDPGAGLGDSSLVDGCPGDEKQMLRFVGAGVPDPSATVYVACVNTLYNSAPASCTPH